MKYIILFLSLNLFAAPFVSREHIEDWHNKVERVYTSYGTERECIANHGVGNCFNLRGRNINVVDIMEREVDDPKRPIYAAKTDITPCKIYDEYMDEDGKVSPDDCRLLVAFVEMPKQRGDLGGIGDDLKEPKEPTEKEMVPDLCSDKTYYPVYRELDSVTKDGYRYEAYCTKLLGYEKKLVEVFDISPERVAAYEKKQAELEAKEEAIKIEREQARVHIESVKGDVEKLDARQLATLIEKILILLER